MKLILTALLIHSVYAAIDYIQAFSDLRDSVVWPTPNSDSHYVSSTFGPRIRASCDCDDFHRGIDIHGNIGEPVVATYDGEVVKVVTYTSGGLTVILEHAFGDWVKLHPDKGSTKRWYTHYMHLNAANVAVGDEVQAGQVIAELGDSGSTVNPHLHHEVRVGTRCSLEWALENEWSKCNTKNYDPHVHPMMVYPSDMVGPTDLTMSVLQDEDEGAALDGIVHVQTMDNAANLNKYKFEIFSTDGTSVEIHVLDYNLRTGYDATSTANLDSFDVTKPYVSPIPFGYTASHWSANLVIPHVWVNQVNCGGCTIGHIEVSAYDVWGGLAGFAELLEQFWL